MSDANSESSSVELSTGGEAVPDQVIVKFKEDVPPADEDDALLEEGLEKKEDLELIDAEVVKTEEKAVEQAVSDLESLPEVEYAEPNYILRPHGYADEPRFGEQWGLNNTGQTVSNVTGVADFDINGLEASATTQGAPNLVVAVIDDGVDFSHPDLSDRAWTNPGESGESKETNGIDDDANGHVDDVNGWDFVNNDNTVRDTYDYHGTNMAGIIAASVNGQGVVGVAPNVKVMALKFLQGRDGGTVANEIKALQYATSMGVRISNNSYGGTPFSQAEQDAIEASGQLFVASAGNGGTDNVADDNDDPARANYPSSYDSANILSVAAINNQGNRFQFSNYGADSVDLSAPGVNILSPDPSAASYQYRSGTSEAAAYATGTAALAASVNPGLLADPAALKKRIIDTSKPVPSTAGKTVTGGMVDAQAVTNAASTPPSLAPGDEDTAAPTGSVSINDGAGKTRKRKVTLTLGASDPEPGSGVTQMRFSRNDGRTWTTWQPYASSASFKLGKRAGKQKVYAQFRDSAGNESSTFQDSIKYAPR